VAAVGMDYELYGHIIGIYREKGGKVGRKRGKMERENKGNV